MFNVKYSRDDGSSSLYLACPVQTKHQASVWLARFVTEYIGQQMPDGKGVYPFSNPRIVSDKL